MVVDKPMGSPFAPTITRTLRYSDVHQLVEPAASMGITQIYRSGDVYDPDYSNVGHQPMYFDQLCASSGPYMVFSVPLARFRLKFVNNTTNVPAVLAVYVSMAASPTLTRTEAVEKPYSWSRILAPLGSGNAVQNCTYTVDNPKYVGVQPQTYVAQYTGNYGASSGGPYLVIAVYGIGGVADVTVEVVADFTTKFYQLGNMTTS